MTAFKYSAICVALAGVILQCGKPHTAEESKSLELKHAPRKDAQPEHGHAKSATELPSVSNNTESTAAIIIGCKDFASHDAPLGIKTLLELEHDRLLDKDISKLIALGESVPCTIKVTG